MKSAILKTFAFNLNYANMLVKDIDEARMAEQPAGVPNHAAWVLGHLATSCDFTLSFLGRTAKGTFPDEWEPLFGHGSTPVTDRAKYASKAVLLKALEQTHALVETAVKETDIKAFDAPTPHEGFAKMFPTIGESVVFMMTTHEAMHLGQLSSWRRAAGLGSVM